MTIGRNMKSADPNKYLLIIPFAAAGIAGATSHMESNGIERVRSSIAQWLFAFMAGDICGVALYAAQFLVLFVFPLYNLREPLR